LFAERTGGLPASDLQAGAFHLFREQTMQGGQFRLSQLQFGLALSEHRFQVFFLQFGDHLAPRDRIADVRTQAGDLAGQTSPDPDLRADLRLDCAGGEDRGRKIPPLNDLRLRDRFLRTSAAV
jgi:hypothetical protein